MQDYSNMMSETSVTEIQKDGNCLKLKGGHKNGEERETKKNWGDNIGQTF